MFEPLCGQSPAKLPGWKVTKIDFSHVSQRNYSKRTLSYYKRNPGVVLDFSFPTSGDVQPTTLAPQEREVASMSNKRPFEGYLDKSNGNERESPPHHRKKRARMRTESSTGETKSTTTPKKTNKSTLPSYHQYKESPKQVQKQTVFRAEKSWHHNKSGSQSTQSSVSSLDRSLPSSQNFSETFNPTSPKTWSAEVKVNSAERRLARIQQGLKRNQELASCSSSSDPKPLVHASVSATKAVGVERSPIAYLYDNPPSKKYTTKHSNNNTVVKRPESSRPVDGSHLHKSKGTGKKESLEQQASCSSTPSLVPGKNFAAKRLERIQEQFQQQRASTSSAQGVALATPSTAPAQTSYTGQSWVSESQNVGLKEDTDAKYLYDRSPIAYLYDNPPSKKYTTKRSNNNTVVKRPETSRPVDGSHLHKSKGTGKKESLEQQASCSSTPSLVPGKNFAAKRLERIQEQFQQQRASTSSAQGVALATPSTAPAQTSYTGQSWVSESQNVGLKEDTDAKYLYFSGAPKPLEFNEETNNDVEEKMDWEPTDHQLNSMILDIQQVRTQFHARDLKPTRSVSNFEISSTNEKCKYFFVLDSNFLMGHLKVVEALRDRQFQDLEPLVLILPWIVIQELDKLKDWKSNRNNDGHTAMAALLARTAVKWINLQLQGRHPRVKGQTSFNRTESLLACRVADDSILACCKEMEPFAENVVLLTEDVNLSTKALMLGIQVLSQNQLKARLKKSNQDTRHSSNVLAENVVNREEAQKSDMILCDVKTYVRNYLEEVAQIKMLEAYGNTWIVTLNISLPWLGLSDVIQFIIKRWMSVFGYACRDRKDLSKFQALLSFLKDYKSYNHTLKEVEHFIDMCIDAVNSMQIKPNCVLQEGCLRSLMQLRDQCKNLPAKPAVIDFGAEKLLIEKPLEEMWVNLHNVSLTSCEFFKIKHDMPMPMGWQPTQMSREQIKVGVIGINSQFRSVISCLNALLEIPAHQLKADNEHLRSLHRTLTQLSMGFGSEKYPSIESLAAYFANEANRQGIQQGINRFWYYNKYLQILGNILKL